MARETVKRRKGRSRVQRSTLEAARAKLAGFEEEDKENIPPRAGRQPAGRNYQSLYYRESKKAEKWKNKHQELKKENRELCEVVPKLKEKAEDLEKRAHNATQAHDTSMEEVHRVEASLKKAQGDIRTLEKRDQRVSARIATAVAAQREKDSKLAVKEKGIYSPGARTAARILTKFGVAEKNVGEVIQKMGSVMGKKVETLMGARSVARAIQEGGCAAEIQIGFEVANTENLTFCSDSTSHRSINYDARGVILEAPNYAEDSSQSSATSEVPSKYAGKRLRSLGVESSVNHSSALQVQGLKNRLTEIGNVFNNSPLAQSMGLSMSANDFIHKCRGTVGDHAADQKADFALMKIWKESVRDECLGMQQLESLPKEELVVLLAERKANYISGLGGESAWMQLDSEEKARHEVDLLAEIARDVGKHHYDALPEDEKKKIGLFLRAGCCMHKDLNAVKGGAKGMGVWWDEVAKEGVVGPVMLANKDNAAIIESSTDKVARKRAEESTGRGGVKATALGGMICRNKDDKKGQQDIYQWYFKKALGYDVTYPGVSSTRYQSHSEAAGEILVHLETYRAFMIFVRDRKVAQTFTNVEKNFNTALHDVPTLTELAVLGLYAQTITHPYMRQVRGPGTSQVNNLDLGPLHRDLRRHIQVLIDTPSLIISRDATYKTAALDGKPWFRPEVVTVVNDLQDHLPFLGPLFLAFMKGALETWTRFSAEFDVGGVVDQLDDSMRTAAFMPSTNDAMEGALGSFRVNQRRRPAMTTHQFTAKQMYNTNDTEDFMAKHLSDPANQKYLREQTRKKLDDRPQLKVQIKQMEAEEHTVTANREKREKREQKAKAHQEKVDGTVLELDEAVIQGMFVRQLDEQLDKHRQWDAKKEIPKKKDLGNKVKKRTALLEVVARYKANSPAHSSASGTPGAPIGDEMSVSDDVEMAYESENDDMEY